MKRVAFLLALMTLGVSAFAQTQINGQQIMTSALRWVGEQPILYVQLQGSQKIGNQVKTVDYEAYITRYSIGANGKPQPSDNATAYLDLEAYVEQGTSYVPIFRIVGDGKYLWKYNYQQSNLLGSAKPNSYSSIAYTTNTSENPVDKMLSALSGITDQYSNDIALLFRQALSTTEPPFQPWIGGATLSQESNGSALLYGNGSSNLNFYVSVDKQGETHLNSVFYNSAQEIANAPVTTQWTMSVWPLSVVSQYKFKFLPPPGSLPIAVEQVKGN